ncbi:MAG: Gfo/Idh/MocA family oxidoreductase [Verrucomicrobia bacterium]|nr:Gfo/Idh/MocA family oxidoreductase [Verrucomicrobiota bacterium]
MNTTSDPEAQSDLNRRAFLKGGSVATLMAMMGGVPLIAQEKTPEGATKYKTSSPPVNCGVIGLGYHGRDILATLARLPNAPVVAICDKYPAFLNRSKELAPKAAAYADYKELLADKNVKAVIIATPTHQHKQVVLDVLAAGKHVYCEAPLAHSIDDAKAIAQAAKVNPKLYFQAGLQDRADPQRLFVLPFVRSGGIGTFGDARMQSCKKQSWRRASPNPEREKEINWRLVKNLSTGLVGELGIHSVDVACWFLNERPKAVTGFGALRHWKDGRDVPDSVRAVFEFPSGVTVTFDGSLLSSFDTSLEVYTGSDATILVRDFKAWMFKEADAPLLGWEVYARKDEFYKQEGIALVANASKASAQGGATDDPAVTGFTPLYYALETFVTNTDLHHAAVEDFAASFGANADAAALNDYLKDLQKTKKHAATAQDGYEATALALKANEAILAGKKIELGKELFAPV